MGVRTLEDHERDVDARQLELCREIVRVREIINVGNWPASQVVRRLDGESVPDLLLRAGGPKVRFRTLAMSPKTMVELTTQIGYGKHYDPRRNVLGNSLLGIEPGPVQCMHGEPFPYTVFDVRTKVCMVLGSLTDYLMPLGMAVLCHRWSVDLGWTEMVVDQNEIIAGGVLIPNLLGGSL